MGQRNIQAAQKAKTVKIRRQKISEEKKREMARLAETHTIQWCVTHFELFLKS